MNIISSLKSQCESNPDRSWIFFNEKSFSFGQIESMTNSIANGLKKIGISKNSTVGVMLPNCPEFIISWLGINKTGGIMVPFNIALKEKDLSYQINHSEIRVMFVHAFLLEQVLKVKGQCPNLQQLIVVGGEEGKEILKFENLLADSPKDPGTPVDDLDVMEIIYTSGTTGNPKGVVWKHGALTIVANEVADFVEITSRDRLMVVLPLFHGNAQLSTAMSLVKGASMVIIPKFSATQFWDMARKYKCTEVNLLGPVLTMLYNQPPREDDSNNPINLVFCAATPPTIHEAFEERFNLTIVEGYGLTETGINTLNPVDKSKRKIGSIGLPLRYNEVEILDENCNILEPEEEGEICVRPIGELERFWKIEYYKDPESTKILWRGGWLHTGDMGKKDKDGFLYFLDRIKDIIRRRGENISSQEVEGVLIKHPQVLEVAVLGVPSEIGEEEVLALIVPKDPANPPDSYELKKYCASMIADFKVPRYFKYVNELPKTPTGRVKKSELKKIKDKLLTRAIDTEGGNK